MAALRTGLDRQALRGLPFALFDVYGWAVLAAIAVGVALGLRRLTQHSFGERVLGDHHLLPSLDSWFRARVARLPRALAGPLGAATVAFLLAGSALFVFRADETVEGWCGRIVDRVDLDWCEQGRSERIEAVAEATAPAPASAASDVAQGTLFALVGFMVLNLMRSRVSADGLRRVGNVWDVLTFWPRRYHPFAVRPYTQRAVPELQDLLVVGVDPPLADGPLTVLAHSQGSMLVTAALAPYATAPAPRSQVRRLVTVGSPLRSLYMAAFPAYVGAGTVEAVGQVLVGERRWTNAFRFTDHVGRTVFRSEADWVGADGLHAVAGLGTCAGFATTSGAEFTDCAIADPRAAHEAVKGHNDYWEDTRVRRVVEDA
jgi:hypothetical protein